MKHLQRFAGILTAFCLMIILFFTSVEAVVYWTPGYFEKEYTKYRIMSIPTFMVFKGSEAVAKMIGMQDKRVLKEAMDKAL